VSTHLLPSPAQDQKKDEMFQSKWECLKSKTQTNRNHPSNPQNNSLYWPQCTQSYCFSAVPAGMRLGRASCISLQIN
jgi:hypothetical protein